MIRVIPMENFKFFALQYLNDWCRDDSRLVDGLSPSRSKHDRLLCMREAAKYYKIARNFKTLPNELRLDNALQALDAMGDSITDENVDAIVCKLADTFHSVYGNYNVSAASKFLWIRQQTPIVIYDGRAFQCVNKACGGGLREGDYASFRAEWLRQFAMREDCVLSACAELVRVKDFSLAHAKSDEDLSSIIGNRWFAQRVFDTFLWWNAGNGVTVSVEVQTLP